LTFIYKISLYAIPHISHTFGVSNSYLTFVVCSM